MRNALRVFGWLAVLTAILTAFLVIAGALKTPRTWIEGAETIGGWLGLLFVALVGAALSAFSAKARTTVQTPVMIGLLVASVMSVFVYSGAVLFVPTEESNAGQPTTDPLGQPVRASDAPSTHAQVPYKPIGCDITVTFPSEPTVRELEAPGMRYDQAEWQGGVSILRTECLPTSSEISRDALQDVLERQAINDGLQNVAVKNDRYYVELRGYKTIANRPATYVLRWYRGQRSILAVVVASPSADFPTSEIAAFWRSIGGTVPIDP